MNLVEKEQFIAREIIFIDLSYRSIRISRNVHRVEFNTIESQSNLRECDKFDDGSSEEFIIKYEV